MELGVQRGLELTCLVPNLPQGALGGLTDCCDLGGGEDCGCPVSSLILPQGEIEGLAVISGLMGWRQAI
jgi:hypothetical protein